MRGSGRRLRWRSEVGVHDHTHLSQKPVDVHGPVLAKAVDAEDALDVVRWVPGGIEDDDPVGRHQVDAQRACSG